MDAYTDALGAAGSAKYLYQSSRVARGLSQSNWLTASIDILRGGTNLDDLGGAASLAKGLTAGAKGVGDTAKFSSVAKIAGYASKAAPFISKASVLIGGAYGGYQIGSGINELREGNTQAAKDKIISGTADVITSGALAVAGTSAGTVVGLPVAAVALGVAGVSQGAKYAYRYREQIGNGLSWAGGKIAQGYGAVKGAVAGS
jgi:hypothetical protein